MFIIRGFRKYNLSNKISNERNTELFSKINFIKRYNFRTLAENMYT